jgi:hypothetical protein
MSRTLKNVVIALSIVSLVGVFSLYLNAASVGQLLGNVTLRDSNDNPGKTIPDFGRKVVAVFYVDPDESSRNEPLRDALKAAQIPKDKFRAIGVINLKDTWKPNSLIRTMIRKKERKFNSVILTDPDYSLRNAWNLGDASGKDIVIIIGKDRKIKYYNTGTVRGAEIQNVLNLVNAEIAK